MRQKTTLIVWGIALVIFIVGAIAYPAAPQQIPIHWGVDNEVNGYGPKIFLLLYPLFIIGLDLVMVISRKIDPKSKNYNKFSDSYQTLRLILALFLGSVQLISIQELYHPGSMNIAMIVTMMIGIFFIAIGNMMPRFRQNYFAGIRTPWTLADESVWFKTHRIAGRIWFGGGIIITCSAWLKGSSNLCITMTTVLILTLFPFAYSYWLYRTTHMKKENSHD